MDQGVVTELNRRSGLLLITYVHDTLDVATDDPVQWVTKGSQVPAIFDIVGR